MRQILSVLLVTAAAAVSAAPEAIPASCDWLNYAPASEPNFVWTQVAPGDGGTTWYLRIHPADAQCVIQSCDMSATYITRDGNQHYASCNNADWGFPRMHYVSGADFCRNFPNVGYAGCETNGLFKTTDRGATWQRVSTQSLESVFGGKFPRVPISTLAVHPANPDEVWLGLGFPRRLESAGKRRLPQGLAVSRDGGQTWTHMPNAVPAGEMPVSIVILPQLPQTVFVGTDYGVHRSDDGGATFHSIAGNLPQGATFGGFDVIWNTATQRPYMAAALDAQYFFDGDGGAHCEGGIWVSDGAAGQWSDATGDLRLSPALLNSLPECQGGSPWWHAALRLMWREFFAEPTSQQLYHTLVLDYHKDPEPFHKLWRERKASESTVIQIRNRLRNQCPNYLLDFHTVRIDPRDPNVIYASVFQSIPPYGIWKTSNGGQKWYCVTRGARMWEEAAWQGYVPPGEPPLNITQAWTALHPMNYGTPNLKAGFWDIRKFDLAASAPDVLLFHSHRVTYRSENGGASWLDVSNKIIDAQAGTFQGAGNSNMCVFDIEFHPLAPNRVLMWMADCGLKVSSDGGQTLHALSNVMVGSNQWVQGAAFDPADPNRFYAAFDCKDWLLQGLRGRYFLETRDFGATFERTVPGPDASLPPKQTEFTTIVSNMRVDPASPVNARRIIAAHSNLGRYAAVNGRPAVTPEAPPLGVIETLDGGLTWHALNQGFGANKNVVALQTSADFRTLYAAVLVPLANSPGPGGLYRSVNSGQSWTRVTTPIDSVTDVRMAHGKLYITGGVKCTGKPVTNSGGLYVSEDDGVTWRRLLAAPLVSNVAVSPVNPNLIYCTVERDTGNLMQGFGVYRSTDGGLTWSRVNHGLAGAYGFTTLKFHPTVPGQIWLGTYGSGFYQLTDQAGIVGK